MGNRSTRLCVIVVLGVIASLLSASSGGAVASHATRSHRASPSAAVPTIDGPVTGPGDPSLILAGYPFSQVGYAEKEFTFSGRATSYSSASALSTDGKWSVRPATTSAYTSRLVVIAPINRARFSGTVIVEWLNVTGGFDNAVEWIYAHDEMLRSGDAFVGVSAQAVGVNSLKTTAPARYGSLLHPGDSFSYDIFSQAGMAIRAKTSKLLSGLRPRALIAAGESQSAFRLATYVDAVAPLVNVYDAYLIHSRGAGGAALSQAPQSAIEGPSVLKIRTDLAAPVLTFETETDVAGGVLGPVGYFPARQPDSKFFRLWEVAGTAHIDGYNTSGITLNDDGNWAADLQLFALLSSPTTTITKIAGLDLHLDCGGVGMNAGQEHYVANTVLHDLASWARGDEPPPKMPRLEVDSATNPPSYRLDRNGNVRGGVRTPAVDVPLAVLSGLPAPGAPGFCNVFGQTHPFTSVQIAALYPTHADFVHQWKRAVKNAARAGALLPEDAEKLEDVVNGH